MNWGYESKIDGTPIYVNQHNQYCEFTTLDTVNYYYWVEIGNGNGCLTKSYYNLPVFSASLDEELSFGEQSVYFYPNPAYVEINIVNKYPKNLSYYLTDQTGRILTSSEIPQSSVINIDINHFNIGTYYIRINYGNQFFTTKFVKL